MHQKIVSRLAGLALLAILPLQVQAEVLVILPEKGPMAVAANSVREGLNAAYYAGNYRPALRFIDNSERSVADILKTEVKKDTQLIIGPLARDQVEQLIQSKPAIKTLSLNQVSQNNAKVWQFALSPDEDARAITRRMQADGLSEMIVLTQPNRAANTARFREAMNRLWGNKLIDARQVPKQIEAYQGLLLLGDGTWLDQLKRLPSDKIYTIPLGVEENASLPNGLQFCDLPALYKADWPELLSAYQQKPVSMPYQRLLAFGADAWQIARVILHNQPSHSFEGRTGQLKIVDNVIERRPACMRVESNGLKFY